MENQRTTLVATVLAACTALFLMVPSTAFAQGGFDDGGTIGQGKNFGIGVGGGSIVSGLTLKGYFSEDLAGQLFIGGAGAYGYPGYGFGLDGDIVAEFPITEAEGVGELFFGLGGGGGLYFNTFYGAGSVNLVAELGWHFTEIPIELVIDYRPTVVFGSYNDDVFTGLGPFVPWGFSGAFRFYF